MKLSRMERAKQQIPLVLLNNVSVNARHFQVEATLKNCFSEVLLFVRLQVNHTDAEILNLMFVSPTSL